MLLHPRMMLSWAQKMKRPFSPSCRQTIDLGAPTTTYLFLILTVIMSLPLALWSAVLRKCLVECSSKHEDLAKTMVVDRPFADMVQLPQPFWASKASSFDGSQLLGITPHHWTSRDDDECGWVGDGVGEGKIREHPRFLVVPTARSLGVKSTCVRTGFANDGECLLSMK
jgi:hypothetical protein